MSSRAPVSVVIVTWNAEPHLADCLDSLALLERPPEEIVVVDSASTDRTREIASGYPELVRIDCATNVGYCRGNNLGIARTTCPFVLALNPDTRLRPRFLEELLVAFEDPSVGIAAGKLLRFDEATLDSAGQELARSRQPLDRGYGVRDRGQFDRDDRVFGACGAAALYRRAMLDSIADGDGTYFDERFFCFYEDLDLAWRARRAGWVAEYRHRAVALHARGGTMERQGLAARAAAMLGRSPAVRFHIVKNRYLTILRNDSVSGYLANLPFIWARDVATLLLLLLTSPGVLSKLWGARRMFGEALRLGRLDEARPRPQFRNGTS